MARRAFGDAAGFLIGWVVLLDFAVVIALALLFVPHYAAAAIGHVGEVDSPLDQYIAFGLVVLVALWHLRGRPGLRVLAIGASAIDLVMQVLVAALGLALVVDPSGLTTNLDLGVAPTWDALAFSIPIALLAFTGLELVAALLRETKTEPRQVAGWTVGALLVTVLVYVMIAVAALSAYPVEPAPDTPSGYASAISTTWLEAPLAGLAQAIGEELGGSGAAMRAIVGFTAMALLLVTGMAAFVGATRVLDALGQMRGLPGPLARRSRRSGTSAPGTAMIVALVGAALVIGSLYHEPASGLAGIYSFGILAAAMAVFASVIALRFTEPDVERPLRMRLDVAFGSVLIPISAVIGLLAAWALWLLALGSHPAVRTVPPLWLLLGAITFALTRRHRGLPICRAARRRPRPCRSWPRCRTAPSSCRSSRPARSRRRCCASAAKLAAAEQGARVVGLLVFEVPWISTSTRRSRARPSARAGAACSASSSRATTRCRSSCTWRADARSRGPSSTKARALDAGLILIGAVPRFGQRAGRDVVFSDTVENVLRRAHGRVIVTAFPPGTASIAEPEDPVGAGHPPR